jgi:hypothetical protein
MTEEKRFSRVRFDPIIRGLMQRLPKPGEPWPEDERKEWLQTLEANLRLIYPTEKQKPLPTGAPHAVAAPGNVRAS